MPSSKDHTPTIAPATLHILLALADGPLHGYGVMLRAAAAGLKMGPGTIYGALHRMREVGWIEPTGSEKARGPLKQRQQYGLTAEGRQVLQAEARRMMQVADLVRAHAVSVDDGDTAR